MQNGPYRSQILAPQDVAKVDWSAGFTQDEQLYRRLLSSAQKLRAHSYLADQAIRPDELTADGRFTIPEDETSWHFLLTADQDEVIGCVRYLVHDPAKARFEDLRISRALAFMPPDLGERLKAAVEADLYAARIRRSVYAELGGWAIAEGYRGTRMALETLLASYAWGGLLKGGCICSCTATVRHGSASMLRRIGGRPLLARDGVTGAYWDPRYGCEMEALRFDSRLVQARYERVTADLEQRLQSKPAIQAPNAAAERRFQSSLLALRDAVNVRRGPAPQTIETGEVVLIGRQS